MLIPMAISRCIASVAAASPTAVVAAVVAATTAAAAAVVAAVVVATVGAELVVLAQNYGFRPKMQNSGLFVVR